MWNKFRVVRWAFGVAALAVALAAAGCGGDDNSKDSGGSTTEVSSADGQKAVETATQYTGGTAGKADASATPIVFGFTNAEGANAPAPALGEVTDAAVKFVNEELGGIGGHPLVLKPCNIGLNDEQAQACAQKFANDPEVQAVLLGEVPVGKSQILPTMKAAKKPVFGPSIHSPEEGSAKGAFFAGGGFLTGAGLITYAKDTVKAKTMAQIWQDDPATRTFAEIFVKQAKDAGLDTTVAFIPANSSDVVGPLVAAGVQKADVIAPILTPATCVSVAKALVQMNVDDTPTISPGCNTDATKKAIGDYPTWTFQNNYLLPGAPDPTGQVGTYEYALKKYTNKAAALENVTSAPLQFGTVLWVTKILTGIGADQISTATMEKAAGSYAGPLFLGQPDLKFGAPPFPAVGGLGTRFYTYLGDGKYEDATGGKWIVPGPPQ